MGENEIIEFNVTAAQDGLRLDVYLTEVCAGRFTRSQIKSFIDEGQISAADQKISKSGFKISAGMKIVLKIPPKRELDLSPHDLQLEMVYEDEHLAVVNKPSGLSVHPSDTEEGPTLVHGLLHSLQSLSSVGGVSRPGIVHRIDKGTSGLVVISKTDAAHQGLAKQFKDHSIERVYKALVYGTISKKGPSGRIETFFGRHPKDRKKMTGKLKEGRHAVTNWKLVEEWKSFSLVECRLETGRTHQIRVHLSELGFSIVGDPVYGALPKHIEPLLKKNPELFAAIRAMDHQCLHAESLGFEHPVTKKKLYFRSELPSDFQRVLKCLAQNQ